LAEPISSHLWFESFRHALKNSCGNDLICAQIASDETFARKIAQMTRTYVDKRVTSKLNRDRKARIRFYSKKLGVAIAGLEVASKLYLHRDPDKAACLKTIASDLAAENEHTKQLLRTKRHGRDRDHGLLDMVDHELRQHFGHSITWATLANVVNAGFYADGQQKIVDEVLLRKNLSAFRDANPEWTQLMEETKSS
jgi:hypothetical protein